MQIQTRGGLLVKFLNKLLNFDIGCGGAGVEK